MDKQYTEVTFADGRTVKVRSSTPTLQELAALGGVIVDIFDEGKLDFGRVIRNMPALATVAVVGMSASEVNDLDPDDGMKLVDAAVEWLKLVPLESIVVILGKVGALAKSWADQTRGSARASDDQPQESPQPSASAPEK